MSYQHMDRREVDRVNQLQKQGQAPSKIVKRLQSDRHRKGETGPSQSAVYRLLEGSTYKPQAEQSRGRAAALPRNLVKVAFQERRKLIKKADNEHLVTWGDVHKATKKKLRSQGHLKKGVRMPSEDWMARNARKETSVRARPGKRRISHTSEHKTKRHDLSKKWAKYPKSFWVNEIHAYIDNSNSFSQELHSKRSSCELRGFSTICARLLRARVQALCCQRSLGCYWHLVAKR